MVTSVIQVKELQPLLETGFRSFIITWMLLSGIMVQIHTTSRLRGLDAIKSRKSWRWFKGPSFPSPPEDQWPKQNSAEVNQGDPEVNPAVSAVVIILKQDLFLLLEGIKSSW